jgi:hypothetical protein
MTDEQYEKEREEIKKEYNRGGLTLREYINELEDLDDNYFQFVEENYR